MVHVKKEEGKEIKVKHDEKKSFFTIHNMIVCIM